MSDASPTCPRHPDTPTRLRCSACDEYICPSCWREAVIGYHCPDCADKRERDAEDTGRRIAGSGKTGAAVAASSVRGGGTLPGGVVARSTSVGIAAAVAGGLVLAPVFIGGMFFLLSAGVIGWLVARAVYWASDEQSTPYVRAIAITMAGFAVAIGSATAGVGPIPAGAAALAYPAALWGGWLVVRQR